MNSVHIKPKFFALLGAAFGFFLIIGGALAVSILKTPTSSTSAVSDSATVKIEESEYGFSFQYPKTYTEDSQYAIWNRTLEQPGLVAGMLYDSGINFRQETIFSIDVYPLERKKELFEHFDWRLTNETVIVGGKVGQYVYPWRIALEHKGYIFIIYSSFLPDPTSWEDLDASETYKALFEEFKNILYTLEFH